jgi:8-oxo-dGTP diphosphatase
MASIDPQGAPGAAPRKQILVAAAVVLRGGRVLLTQRKKGTHLAGAWEFPGGKVEPDEDPKHAVARELREELGVEVDVGDILEVTFHRYPEKSVLLLFYEASLAASSPEPQPIDVADLVWAGPGDLRDEAFPPADVAVLAKVRARLATSG